MAGVYVLTVGETEVGWYTAATCLSIIPLHFIRIREMWPLANDILFIHFPHLEGGTDITNKEFSALPGGYLKSTLHTVEEKHQ